MPEEEQELTPIELSIAQTGRRNFAAPEAVFQALSQTIDDERGYPRGVGSKAVTMRGLPPLDQVERRKDGWLIISVESWRITEADNARLAGAAQAGQLEELTWDEYQAAKPETSDGIP